MRRGSDASLIQHMNPVSLKDQSLPIVLALGLHAALLALLVVGVGKTPAPISVAEPDPFAAGAMEAMLETVQSPTDPVTATIAPSELKSSALSTLELVAHSTLEPDLPVAATKANMMADPTSIIESSPATAEAKPSDRLDPEVAAEEQPQVASVVADAPMLVQGAEADQGREIDVSDPFAELRRQRDESERQRQLAARGATGFEPRRFAWQQSTTSELFPSVFAEDFGAPFFTTTIIASHLDGCGWRPSFPLLGTANLSDLLGCHWIIGTQEPEPHLFAAGFPRLQ